MWRVFGVGWVKTSGQLQTPFSIFQVIAGVMQWWIPQLLGPYESYHPPGRMHANALEVNHDWRHVCFCRQHIVVIRVRRQP